MKITRISIFQIDVPIEPFKISHGRVMENFDETIVRIETDTGIEGWGDSVPWGSNFIPAFAAGARAGLKELAPKLIGQDPRMVGAINELMDAEMTGQPFVKTALDVACWDILGHAMNAPLYMLLGGRLTEKLGCYGSAPPTTGPELAEAIARLRGEGHKRFSSKSSGDPEADIEYLRTIGELMRPGESLKYDANAGWRVDEALRIARMAGQVDVLFEQPCATYEECREVRRSTNVPLILDESASDLNVVLRAKEDGVLDGLNLKLAKVGGISKMRVIRDVCAALKVPMDLQDSSWSELACAVVAHMGQSTPSRSVMTALMPMGMKKETVINPPRRDGRFVTAPDLPGIGTRPMLEVLGEPIAVFS